MTSKQRLLIALNAAPDLSRDAICRLAADVDRWPGSGALPALAEVADRTGLSRKRVRAALRALSRADEIACRQLHCAERIGALTLTRLDRDYPEALRDLPLAPAVIHCLGSLPTQPGFSVVGSRNATPYGLEAADRFARRLAGAGLVVVSGMARGIDGAAHRGALDAAGSTLAVLAGGLDRVYPRSHAGLARDIARSGAVISEFPLGTPPLRHHFPIRNRLIAALGIGTLVIQATVRSGSLITAGQALDLGRQVWAVPGSIFEGRAAGVNRLLRDGAFPALDARDILEALPAAVRERLRPIETVPAETANGDAAVVLSALSAGRPRAADQVAQATGLGVGEVLAALSQLELTARVRRYPGPAFCRRET